MYTFVNKKVVGINKKGFINLIIHYNENLFRLVRAPGQ